MDMEYLMIAIGAAGQVGLTVFGLMFLGKLLILSFMGLSYAVGTPFLWAWYKLNKKLTRNQWRS